MIAELRSKPCAPRNKLDGKVVAITGASAAQPRCCLRVRARKSD